MPSPTGFSETTQKDFSYLGENNIRALLSGSKWGTGIGNAFTLTYSFPWTTRSDGMASWEEGYVNTDLTNFNLSNEPYRAASNNLNATQQNLVKDALSKWANVANVKFNFVPETATPPQVGDLRFAFTSTDGNEGGHAYLTSTSAIAGDIWLPSEQNISGSTFENPVAGKYGYLTFLHEIGHALGLKHTFEGYALPVDQDWFASSVMSYNAWKRSDDPNQEVKADFYPTTPMWYDIFAMQFLYGANNSYRTGDDVYTYRENEHYWETIWDAGGNDTINYIGSVPAKIDLRDGAWSDMGLDVQLSNNKALFGTITIFRDVIIENASGGSGDDTLQGNNVDNVLDGYWGADTAIFEGNKSDYKIQKVGDSYIVNSIAEGKDTLKNIEFVQFKDGTFAIDSILEKNQAPTGSVTIYGTIQQGQTLTISNSLTDADGLGTFSYQWFRGLTANDAISGATQSAYTLTADDVGKKISVIVGYVDGLGKQEGVFSSETTLVTALVNHAPTGTVIISGEAQEGKTLTVSNTLVDADGMGEISYQWSNWTGNATDGYKFDKISGTTQTTYTLTAADIGKGFYVKASYIDKLNNFEGVLSNFTNLVTAIPVNRVPVGSSTLSFFAINEDNGSYAWKDADYFQGFSDPDGDSLQAINIKATNATIIRSSDGTWTLTPNANFNGIVELTYDVIDNKGGSIPAKMSFVINPVNDAPIGKAVGFAAGNEDTNYILTASGLQDGFSDVDFDTLSVTNLTATNGKITANADGTWLLTPNVNFNGTVQLNYTVSDNKGGSTNAVINFVLNPVNDAPIGSVFVSGETQQGKILAASNTLFDADGIGVISYQWLSNGSVINGANQTIYTLTTSDVGKAISVKASYVDLQGTAESVSSSTTTLISALTNYPPTGNVKITGNAIVSGTLSIENTLADGNGVGSFMYQWLRNNDAITNATKSTYTLTPEDAGEKITVVVGYIDGLGKQEGLASDAISILIPNHQPTGSLVIKGSPTVGNTLTLINTIQDADGLGEFSYSWETEDIVLTLSFDSETLKIASDAFGKEIWATIFYTDGAGNFEEIKSEPTLAVTVAKVSTVSSTGNDLITGTNKAEKLLGFVTVRFNL